MRQRYYIFIECRVGKVGATAQAIATFDLPFYLEIASISGPWDLLLRAETDQEISHSVVDRVQALDGVIRTQTEVAYPIFDPADVFF